MRRRTVAVLVAAVLVVVAALSAWLLGRDDQSPIRRTALSVTVQVTELGSGVPVVHREFVEVDRPYRARLRILDADGTTTRGGFVWTESGLFTLTSGGVQRSQDIAPSRPGPDSYLDVALPVAEQQHLVRRAGTAVVLGRPCTWWLSRLALDSVPLELPRDGDEVRSCVGADGLVLSEQWTIAGHRAVEREVVAVGTSPALTDQVLFGGPPPSGGLGLTVVRALTGPATPPLAVRAVAPGAGWTFDRAAVSATLDRPGGEATSNSDRAVYVRAGGLAWLDEEQDLSGPPGPLSRGERVALGALGEGRLTAGYDGLALRFLQPDGVVVTLSGHLTRADLLAWAAALAN